MKNKKQKTNKKYITVIDGVDFRRIANMMTEAGMPMNHATARNQLMSAMENLFSQVGNQMGIKLDKKRISDIIHSQDVHNALSDVLLLAYNKSKNRT